MRTSFGSAVDTAIDNAVRVSSAIADLASGRGVDLNALIPQLSTVFDSPRGMASWGQKVEKLAIGSLDNSTNEVLRPLLQLGRSARTSAVSVADWIEAAAPIEKRSGQITYHCPMSGRISDACPATGHERKATR